MIIAIDPGANGSIAFNFYNKIHILKMPETAKLIYESIHAIVTKADGHEDVHCFLEKVGGYVPGNAGPAAVKFARHCGHLEMSLIALRIQTTFVAPAVWMRKVLGGNILYPIGMTSAKKKTYRKNIIKSAMQKKNPSIKVTLAYADALGIMDYAQIIQTEL